MYLLSDPCPSLFRLAVGRGLSGVVSPVSQKEKRKGEEEAAEKACLVCQSPLFSNCIGIAKAKSGASTMAIGEELAGSSFAIFIALRFPQPKLPPLYMAPFRVSSEPVSLRTKHREVDPLLVEEEKWPNATDSFDLRIAAHAGCCCC